MPAAAMQLRFRQIRWNVKGSAKQNADCSATTLREQYDYYVVIFQEIGHWGDTTQKQLVLLWRGGGAPSN